MKKKQFKKALDAYAKGGDLKPLTRMLIELIFYMAKEAKGGYEVKFLDTLPYIVDSLKSLDLKQSLKK